MMTHPIVLRRKVLLNKVTTFPRLIFRKATMRNSDIRGLYYITHIDNLPSILERGILSHEKIQTTRIPYTRIYDNSIVERRRHRSTPEGRSLWHYVNLFFQPRNPMLYRVIDEIGSQNLAVLRVANTVLQESRNFHHRRHCRQQLNAYLPST